jgi:calcium-dependent protein kinase
MMELCSGGTLSQMMKGKAMKALPFPLFTLYARQMISASAYMHHHRFAHRDIKPSNFMLHDTHVDSSLKLIDMGFACHVEVGVPLTLRIGTVECSAPEVIRGSYDEKCDVWSIGVVLYYCRVGIVHLRTMLLLKCVGKSWIMNPSSTLTIGLARTRTVTT